MRRKRYRSERDVCQIGIFTRPLRNIIPKRLSWFKIPKKCVLPLGNQRKRNTSVFPQFLPILRRKSFVAILLCRNLNSNTLNFVSVVHRNGSWWVFSRFTWLYIRKNIFRKPRSLAFHWRRSLSFENDLIIFCKLSRFILLHEKFL